MQVRNLKAYLANIEMSVRDFAEIIECDHKYVSRLINGTSYPSKRLQKDIRVATGGLINIPLNPNPAMRGKKKKKAEQQQEQPA